MKSKFTFGAVLIAAGLVYLFVSSVEQSAATHVNLDTLLEDSSTYAGRRLQRGPAAVHCPLGRWLGPVHLQHLRHNRQLPAAAHARGRGRLREDGRPPRIRAL